MAGLAYVINATEGDLNYDMAVASPAVASAPRRTC